jgi:hypothetical protein
MANEISGSKGGEHLAHSLKMISNILGTDDLAGHIRSLSELVTAAAENVGEAVVASGKENLKIKWKVQSTAHAVRDTTDLAILYLDCLTDFADLGRSVERTKRVKEAIMKTDMASFRRYLSDLHRLIARTEEAREAFLERYKEADNECSEAQATCAETAIMRRGDKFRCRLTGAATIGLGFAIGGFGVYTSKMLIGIGGASVIIMGVYTIIEGELAHSSSQKKLSKLGHDLFQVVEAINNLHVLVTNILRLGERAKGSLEELEAKSSQQSSGIDAGYLNELCDAVSMVQDRCHDIHCTVSDASERATEALEKINLFHKKTNPQAHLWTAHT